MKYLFIRAQICKNKQIGGPFLCEAVDGEGHRIVFNNKLEVVAGDSETFSNLHIAKERAREAFLRQAQRDARPVQQPTLGAQFV
jgi:hypothetical protein